MYQPASYVEPSVDPPFDDHSHRIQNTLLLTLSTPTHSLPLPKRHLWRQPETRTEHPLLRRDVPDLVHMDILVPGAHHASQFCRHALTDLLRLAHVIVALGAKAVHVDHGQLDARIRSEERLVPGVQAREGWQEGDGCSGQVHDEVGYRGRDGEGPFLGSRGWGEGDGVPVARGFGRDGDGVLAAGVEGEEVVGGEADEVVAVGAEGVDEVGELGRWLVEVRCFGLLLLLRRGGGSRCQIGMPPWRSRPTPL